MKLLGAEETRSVKIQALILAAVGGGIFSAWVLGVAVRVWAVPDDALTVVVTVGGAASAVFTLWILPAALRKGLVFWSSLLMNLDTRFYRFVLAEMFAVAGSLLWAGAIVNLVAQRRV